MLSPYRVLDLSDHRGHLAGFILAMLGAEVIAVEPPGGQSARKMGPWIDGLPGPERSLTHLAYNRAKRSIVLDLAGSQADRDEFIALVVGADVLIDSAGPGEPASLAALGFGPAALAELNPSLITASVTAFGAEGPRSQEPATDLTVQASAYSMSLNGDADRAPVRVTAPQAFHFGASAAASAIVVALFERGTSGLGQHLDASAQAAVLLANQAAVLAERCNAPGSRRSAGGARIGPLDLRFVYRAKDGFVSITHVFGDAIGPRTAALMAWAHEVGCCSAELAAKDWVRFAELVDQGAETVATFEEAKAAIEAATSAHTKAELLEIATQRRLLMAPISTPQDVVGIQHYHERGFFEQVSAPTEARTVPLPGVYFRRNGERARARLGWAPTLDADAAALRAEPPRRPAAPAVAATESGSSGRRALEGLKVVDLSWSIAGPVTARFLCDHGADVLKIESITKPDAARGFMPVHDNVPGIEQSAIFDDMNAAKRSVALNLTKPEAREVLLDLVRWADLLFESYSPRALKSWGLGYDEFREVNPSLVMVSTCLFGQDGPLSTLAGYGNLGAALSGFYALTGWPDRTPAGPYLAYTDYTSNTLQAAAVVAALDHRRRTGEGSYLDLAQSEAAMHFLGPELAAFAINGEVADRLGNRDPNLAPHGLYPSLGEDRWVAIVCQDDAAWPALCAVIGRDDLAQDAALATAQGRLARVDELDAAVAAWTSTRTGEDAAAACRDSGVAAQFVWDSAECLADPQLIWRRHFVELDHPDRDCIVENTRVLLSRTPGSPAARAPFIGEHTFDVLSDVLGYDTDRIADLAAAEALE